MSKRRKGVLVLSEGRSGSNWLGSLAHNAGLGHSKEWLDPKMLGIDPSKTDYSTYFEAALERSSEGCAGFYVKIFPRHLYEMREAFGMDFIAYCHNHHDVALITLTRADRLRQAVSFSRALQSSQWTARNDETRRPEYDFQQIARCLFTITRSYSFWEDYLRITGFDATGFVYEDLVPNANPFLAHIAKYLGACEPEHVESDLRVQRDEVTEEWLTRFKADAADEDLLDAASPVRPTRSRKAFLRLLKKKNIRLPYTF
ncbi:Stf0 family sulfotransferase [Thioclava sp. UBA3469]|uniref:Stf0 family sulfotransferase n=1 Tax=Thioclava sp. UBA3469 TaxID=1947693 RepID=UPI00257CCA54|nr:Stf0 family sulfotransferase [Thioclava sp. UBA3469]